MQEARIGTALQGVLQNVRRLIGLAHLQQGQAPGAGRADQVRLHPKGFPKLREGLVGKPLFEQGLAERFVAGGVVLPLQGQAIFRHGQIVTLLGHGLVADSAVLQVIALPAHQALQFGLAANLSFGGSQFRPFLDDISGAGDDQGGEQKPLQRLAGRDIGRRFFGKLLHAGSAGPRAGLARRVSWIAFVVSHN